MYFLLNPYNVFSITIVAITVYRFWGRNLLNKKPNGNYVDRFSYEELLDRHENSLEKNEILQRNLDTLSKNVKTAIKDKHTAILAFEKRNKELTRKLIRANAENGSLCMKIDKKSGMVKDLEDQLSQAKSIITDLQNRLAKVEQKKLKQSNPFDISGRPSMFDPIPGNMTFTL